MNASVSSSKAHLTKIEKNGYVESCKTKKEKNSSTFQSRGLHKINGSEDLNKSFVVKKIGQDFLHLFVQFYRRLDEMITSNFSKKKIQKLILKQKSDQNKSSETVVQIAKETIKNNSTGLPHSKSDLETKKKDDTFSNDATSSKKAIPQSNKNDTPRPSSANRVETNQNDDIDRKPVRNTQEIGPANTPQPPLSTGRRSNGERPQYAPHPIIQVHFSPPPSQHSTVSSHREEDNASPRIVELPDDPPPSLVVKSKTQPIVIGSSLVPNLDFSRLVETTDGNNSLGSTTIGGPFSFDIVNARTGRGQTPLARQIVECVEEQLTPRRKEILCEQSIVLVVLPGGRLPGQENQFNTGDKAMVIVVPLTTLFPGEEGKKTIEALQDATEPGDEDSKDSQALQHYPAHHQELSHLIPSGLKLGNGETPVYIVCESKGKQVLLPISHGENALGNTSIDLETGRAEAIDPVLWDKMEDIYVVAHRLSHTIPWIYTFQFPSFHCIYQKDPWGRIHEVPVPTDFYRIEQGMLALEDLSHRYINKRSHPESEVPHMANDCLWAADLLTLLQTIHPELRYFISADITNLLDAGQKMDDYLHSKKL